MQLLERDAQLRALEGALSAVKGGEGGIALVSGEAGIGKTSLVEHFLRGEEKTWRVLRGACDSLFTPRPLGPLQDIALQTGGSLLSLIEKESRLPAIFSACLVELQSEPTIVLIEDIHWADEATLDLLTYLGRRVGATTVLLILTFRDDELGVDHPLRLLLGDLVSSRLVRRIPVGALSSDAVRSLAEHTRVDPAELHRLTNGNPFYVTEVLAGGGGIPATVRDAVLARAARLSPAARKDLEAAAVIGLRAESGLMLRVSEAEAAGVEECISKGMLRSEGSFYVFRHELARETILESIPAQRRIDLHRRVLTALQASPEGRQDLTRLASHAQGTGEGEAVLQFAPAAARQAAALSAHRQAVALYELALLFADQLSTAERAGMLDAYALELWFAGRVADSVIIIKRAIDLWHLTGDRLREGDDLVRVAEVQYSVARTREGAEAGEAAIAMLEQLPASAELGRAYTAQCFIEMERRDSTRALAWGEKAFALSQRFGDTESQARVSNYMGCAAMIGDYERGRQLMERSLQIGRENDVPFAIAGTLANWAQMLLEIWRPTDAARFLDEGIPYAVEHDDHYHLQLMLTWQAQLRLAQGSWRQAETIISDLLRAPNIDKPSYAYSNGLATLGRVLVRRGDTMAWPKLDEALALSGGLDQIARFGITHAARAEAAWMEGDDRRAAAEAEAAYGAAVSKTHPWIAGELASWMWRAGVEVSPPDWIARPFAMQIAGDWLGAASEWEDRGCPYEQAMALMEGDEAAQLAGLAIFERLGARPIIAKLKRKLRQGGVRGIPRGPRPTTRENAYGLTARELEVIGCLARGSSNNEIAGQLSLSARTVEHHIASILQKTGVQSRGEAAALAVRDGLVPSQ